VPEVPSSQFLAAAGGPAASLTLFGVAGLVCTAAGWELVPEPAWAPATLIFQWLFLWNGILILANVVPCTPLDGGRMFQALLWGRLGDRDEAERFAARVGHVVATLAVVGALCIFFAGFADREYLGRHPFLANLQWALLLVAIAHLLETKLGGERLLQQDAEERGIFGYDFSGGYTSLERTAARDSPATRESSPPATRESRRPASRESVPVSAWARLRARFGGKAGAARKDVEDEERLDRILEKIHAEGIASLRREERKFLERMSRRKRK
jgi:hypothetical protein